MVGQNKKKCETLRINEGGGKHFLWKGNGVRVDVVEGKCDPHWSTLRLLYLMSQYVGPCTLGA